MFDIYKWAVPIMIGFVLIFYLLSYQMYVKIRAHPNLDFIEIICGA